MSTWVVAMVHQMSGGRYDDRQWPPPGYEFEVPDWEGEGMVRTNSAVKIRELPEDKPAHVTPPAPVSEPSETAAGPESSREKEEVLVLLPGEAVHVEAPAADPPKPADPKQDWMDYAVTQGMTEDEAGAMTKADLMSRFGGRL